MTENAPVTACLIVIGNEILSGRTQDSNLKFLGGRLNGLGVRLVEARMVADEEDAIIAAVNECRAAYDYVFTTGGIGPTHDDITPASVAKAFGVPLRRDEQALAWLREHYQDHLGDLNEARLKMADVPEGAILIENPVSKAPGFQMENVFVLAGVPMIMEAMFEDLKDRLSGGQPMRSVTLSAYITEGDMAVRLAEIQARRPETEIGSYPFLRNARLGLSVVVRATDDQALKLAVDEVRELIRFLGAKPLEHG